MEEIIKTFHLNIGGIVAQIINFSIVLFVLYKFAYKPLLIKMKEREDIIEKGLADAKKSQEQMAEVEAMREERILSAKKEAKELLNKAQLSAEKNKEEIIQRAREETNKIINEAKIQIQAEKEKMLKESRHQIGEVVALSLEKILKVKINGEKDKELIEETLKEIKNN
jgi:F-type H+-transporting ATPase subunit b